MSESSKDKTKRKLLNYYKNYLWEQQISIFPQVENDEDLINTIPNYMTEFKNKLMRSFPEVAFLVETRRHINQLYKKNQIIMVIHCSKFIDYKKVNSLVEKVYASQVKAIDKKITDRLLLKAHNSIKDQRLHNLEGLLGRKIRRYNIINKTQLRARGIPLSDTNAGL